MKELAAQSALYEQELEKNHKEFEGQKAQLEKELQETKSSLDRELANHAQAKENWRKEMSSSVE